MTLETLAAFDRIVYNPKVSIACLFVMVLLNMVIYFKSKKLKPSVSSLIVKILFAQYWLFVIFITYNSGYMSIAILSYITILFFMSLWN